MEDMTHVESPIVQTEVGLSGRTLAILFWSLLHRTTEDILLRGTVSPALIGVTLALADAMFDTKVWIAGS